MAFLHALEGVISIMIMVMLGCFLTTRGVFNQDNSRLLPKLVNNVALPAYFLWSLMTTFDQGKLLGMVYGLAVPFASMAISLAAGYAASKILKVADNRKGTFRSVFFASSAAFVGIPVNLALFGDVSIPYVVIYILANAFLFWTLGNYFISTDGQSTPQKIFSLDTAKNIFSPPLLGFIFATALILLGVHLPDFVLNTAKYLGAMTTPLALLFVGIILARVKLKNVRLTKDIVGPLVGRFVISPLAVILVAHFIPIPILMKKVFVIQAALPAMTNTTILAKVYGADAEYAAILTTLTTIISMLVIPLYMVAV
ncbi:MAG: AEC family transporter [Negativicutes bacterium]|nr:AEC family transporter [Negativicutes bacterium]